jgi:hypothetical protein
MTAANGYSPLERADRARATQRRIIAMSDASEASLVIVLSFAARHPRYDDVGICRPAQMQIMVSHGKVGIDGRLMHDLRLNEERGFFFCGFVPVGNWIVFYSFVFGHEIPFAYERPALRQKQALPGRKPLTAGI